MLIIQELKERGTDVRCAKQIATLLSSGPMIAVRQSTVDTLAAIIKKHPNEFRAALGRRRITGPRPRNSDRGTRAADFRSEF